MFLSLVTLLSLVTVISRDRVMIPATVFSLVTVLNRDVARV